MVLDAENLLWTIPIPTRGHSASCLVYFRYSFSYRDVEDLLAERGIDVSHETVRRWALKFGQPQVVGRVQEQRREFVSRRQKLLLSVRERALARIAGEAVVVPQDGIDIRVPGE